jgi:hypothetical protein
MGQNNHHPDVGPGTKRRTKGKKRPGSKAETGQFVGVMNGNPDKAPQGLRQNQACNRDKKYGRQPGTEFEYVI